MNYAVIKLGGKQFSVSVGDKIKVETQPEGFDVEVLFASENGVSQFGQPSLEKAAVVLEKESDSFIKTRVARYKPKSMYRKANGHKQPMSTYAVKAISLDGSVEKTSKPVKETKEKTPIAVKEPIKNETAPKALKTSPKTEKPAKKPSTKLAEKK